MRRSHLLAAGCAAASALLLVAPTPASAAPKTPTPSVVASGLAAPFNVAINHGKVFVADGGQNIVGKVRNDGTIKTIVADAIGTSGVATSANGKYLAYTTTTTNEETFENTASALHITGPYGFDVTADTLAYEKANNPDKKLTYGVDNPSQCVTDALTAAGFPVKYRGAIDSHAYSVTAYGKKFVVADAGANDLLLVDRSGKISTIGVLPRIPLKISAAQAAALELPPCVAGVTYSFEAVPTDVEVGKDGWLYVSTLPGGPESPVLGARGRVYRVNPKTGQNQLVARGFLGATNLALGKHGEIYVAELFAGKISVIKHGVVSPYLTLPGVVSVETDDKGHVWATTLGNEDPPAPGTIVKIVNRKIS